MTRVPPPPIESDPRLWDELTVLAATVFLEAEGEPDEGMLAVAYVACTRAERKRISVRSALLAPWQFSCWNADYAAQRRHRLESYNPHEWERAWKWASGAFWGFVPDPTEGADHYLNKSLTLAMLGGTLPSWYDEQAVVAVIGRHDFLRLT